MKITQEWMSSSWWLPGGYFMAQNVSIHGAWRKVREKGSLQKGICSKARCFQQLLLAYFWLVLQRILIKYKTSCSSNLIRILNSSHSEIWRLLNYCGLLGVPYFSVPCLPLMPHLPHLSLSNSTGDDSLRQQSLLLGRTSILSPYLSLVLVNSNEQYIGKPKETYQELRTSCYSFGFPPWSFSVVKGTIQTEGISSLQLDRVQVWQRDPRFKELQIFGLLSPRDGMKNGPVKYDIPLNFGFISINYIKFSFSSI